MTEPCYIGIDFGTSGCRAIAIDRERRVVAEARDTLPEPVRNGSDGVEQDPELWRDALIRVLAQLAGELDSYDARALSVDGTSSTLLLCEPNGAPLGPALMYNDRRSHTEAERIAAVAPETSPARGASSSLAKLLNLKHRLAPGPGTRALHQADWILGYLTGRLEELGATRPTSVLTTGGGAANQGWTRIRQRLLGIPVTSAEHQEAAYGTAVIALAGGIPTQGSDVEIG